MPLIEAALAFAITMLVLSMIVSSFVELVSPGFKMREAGLQYMLGQTVRPGSGPVCAAAAEKELATNPKCRQDHPGRLQGVREGFVARMTANRAPVGLKPDPHFPRSPSRRRLPLLRLLCRPCLLRRLRPCVPRSSSGGPKNVTQPWSDKTKPGVAARKYLGRAPRHPARPGPRLLGTARSVEVGEQIKQAVSGGGHNSADALAPLSRICAENRSVDIGAQIKKGVLETGNPRPNGRRSAGRTSRTWLPESMPARNQERCDRNRAGRGGRRRYRAQGHRAEIRWIRQGRRHLISKPRAVHVGIVAIVLAFAVHVMRSICSRPICGIPVNARAKVIRSIAGR